MISGQSQKWRSPSKSKDTTPDFWAGIGRDRKSMVKFLADQLPGGYGGDYHTSYFPLPSFTSSRRYACHLNSSRYMELDFTHVRKALPTRSQLA